jgi:hypothetical protein
MFWSDEGDCDLLPLAPERGKLEVITGVDVSGREFYAFLVDGVEVEPDAYEIDDGSSR